MHIFNHCLDSRTATPISTQCVNSNVFYQYEGADILLDVETKNGLAFCLRRHLEAS